jgi:hypothetical protein
LLVADCLSWLLVAPLGAGCWCWLLVWLLVLVAGAGGWCWLLVLVAGAGGWCRWLAVVPEGVERHPGSRLKTAG